VPYGQNFDSLRLIRSLCLNEKADSLAITDKGRTAAELMVFARYVMFSEVYWHHTVRSATTMFQRAFYRWHQMKRSQVDFVKQVSGLFESGETEMIRQMRLDLEGESAAEMLDQLFGVNRRLHKRAANFSFNENAATFEKVAYHPYSWLVATSERLTELIAEQVGVQINKDAVLIDAPPVGLEVQFNVDVYSPKTNAYRPLGEVSPVVNTLAKRQFDDFVKQVRVFVEPGLLPLVEKIDLELLLVAAAEN
ncbi:metal-dependent phosphohydrolase, partial [bacterium]|nr:metal-dependent phosphohydrolase [bacterium]